MFKVGDKVRIIRNLSVEKNNAASEMLKYAGKECEIYDVCGNFYLLDIDNGEFAWDCDYIEKIEKMPTLKQKVTDLKPDKITKHVKICQELNLTYKQKNHDYGDSFAKLRKEIPDAILVRIYDKYSRLKTLIQGAEQKVKDESIEDTLKDLANYCIMELVERRADNDN